ncbi:MULTISPECIES: SGNH/GDSL hydrolase family protein [unclassified Rhizobium]|uniref:SGNH/GDSL hydrolase family protein n=1 Tax=unclassified Rhizobium TaxID=2613769 RepID=UPI001ADC0813|nr:MULTISPECIES: SGNH/GDSL hydrolase family protein [unclassified Rhizobium]MBO9125305.1 SGNH/GDSL hydrolase family protein [Rhizobium sp. 16-488-2b]MBO9175890.1 SGNH/GDSL hydrolase family protein [Rhizobium sp. 16-488-2a]
MLLGIALSTTQSPTRQRPGARAIIAFGDSLTEGAGASSRDTTFPAIAANLFDPPRRIINRGIGGQTSTEIAARQGGVPLLLAVAGGDIRNLYPHTRDWMDRFETGIVNGLTHECINKGIDENGLPYGDIRIHGTATAGFTDIGRQIYGAIAANYLAEPGNRWTISSAIQMIAGSTTGIAGMRLLLIEAEELGGYLAEIAAPAFALDGTRSHVSATATNTHNFIRSTHLLDIIPGSAIDITLRIFPGQFEQGAAATALQLTPGDGEIPAYHPEFSRRYRFDQGSDGWLPRLQDGHATPVSTLDGKLIVENDDAGVLRGCELAIAEIPGGQIIPGGKLIHIAFDIELIDGSGQIHVGGLSAPGGSWATTTSDGDPTWPISASGHYELVFSAGNLASANPSCEAIAFLSSGSLLRWSLDNIVIEWGDETPQVEVLYRSVEALHGANGAIGLSGTLAGVEGTLTTDGGTRHLFTRSHAGDAVATAYATPFLPSDATTSQIQWLWAGRNNAVTPETVLSDIAAMTANVPGHRYLIGSILPSAADTPETRQTIAALNADLATLYTTRFVDLHAALTAAANETTWDQQDIAAGLVPRSLRADALHLNDQGYAIAAAAWVSATLAMGW